MSVKMQGPAVRDQTVDFDERKIDAIFSKLNQCQLPGAAVGIAIHGRPVYRKGFGLASMELPLVLSPSIRMRIGSTTKHFAAFAYLLLCEEGRAGIDDPLGKFLPEVHPVARRVTMRQLMSNTSGLHNVPDIIHQFSGTVESVTAADVLSVYKDLPEVCAAPGSAWLYNNGGWVLLSLAIERISNQSFEDVLRQRVFDPVGMYDTAVRRWDADFMPNSSATHALMPDGHYTKGHYVGGVDYMGAGAVVSTVNDMLRWLAHMDAPTIGNPATWSALKTPQTLPNGTWTGYGLGLITGTYRGATTLSHSGGGLGSNAQMIKVPAAGLDIAIMVNRQDVLGISLANEIIDACLPGLDPVEKEKKSFMGPFATGVFRSPTTGRIVQLGVYNQQQILSLDGSDMPSGPDETGVLWPTGVFSTWRQGVVLVGNREKPEAVRLNDFGNCEDLVRVEQAEEPRANSVVGHYRSESTGTEATISQTERGARLSTIGRFGKSSHELESLARGVWRSTVANPLMLPRTGILSFDEDGQTFRYFNATTRALAFKRVA
jgi:CubicO group peptidase (beta-lactamase class C family)